MHLLLRCTKKMRKKLIHGKCRACRCSALEETYRNPCRSRSYETIVLVKYCWKSEVLQSTNTF